MKALVLTCDRYAAFTEHMIASYAALWREHPFSFRVPYQLVPAWFREGHSGHVELRRSPEPIGQTVAALLTDLADDEWIYWCLDDKYLVDLDSVRANRIANWVARIDDPRIAGLSFARARDLLKDVKTHLDVESRLESPDGEVFVRRRTYAQIWLHQFLRVKVLRDLFSRFPDRPYAPKEMDSFKDALRPPAEWQLYVSQDNLVVFGESTTRGRVTRNCVESLALFGLGVPSGFELSERSIVIGSLEQER